MLFHLSYLFNSWVEVCSGLKCFCSVFHSFFFPVLSRVGLNHGREVLITEAARLKAYRPTF